VRVAAAPGDPEAGLPEDLVERPVGERLAVALREEAAVARAERGAPRREVRLQLRVERGREDERGALAVRTARLVVARLVPDNPPVALLDERAPDLELPQRALRGWRAVSG
jgi:hypothetical protein